MPILGVIASSAKGAPAIPTIGTATDVGTARPFNNGAASVTFTAGAGAAATSFTVKAYTTGNVYTGFSTTGASSPLVVTGLASEGVYKYTVFATNASGSSLESGYSNTVTSTTIPAVPTIGTASCANGQAYTGSANVTAAFTPGGTGGKTVTYAATSSSGATGSNSASPVTVTETVGNPTSTARTYTIIATNANGSSAASGASNSVAAISVPQAPTIGIATGGNAVATVTYTANATGGATVSAYTATSSPGSLTGTGASPITVSGLTNGTAYTFTVRATNASGNSNNSAASNSVTPVNPAAYESIATITATSGNSWSFTSIPQTYSHLQIRITEWHNGASGMLMTFNGNTAASYLNRFVGQAATSPTPSYSSGSTLTFVRVWGQYSSVGESSPSGAVIDITDYTSGQLKTAQVMSAWRGNITGEQESMYGGAAHASLTAAITSLQFSLPGVSNTTNLSIGLYGIK
jgi:trimeric autotransporter adhesin